MDRYSYFYGTDQEGVYRQLAASNGLAAFLKKVGAINPGVTMNIVQAELKGFKELDGYRQQSWSDPPVALRYAPMHLYKRADMPKDMQPFYAFSMSAPEGRRGRSTEYTQTILLGREELHHCTVVPGSEGSVSLNYLDQLFGTRFVTAGELEGLRNRTAINLDALPAKVYPVMRPQDRTVVLQTIQAIYGDKAVVLRLEQGCGFNARARELLIQIYSLMQPRLAAEIGFAAYIDPGEISRKIEKTSMRIFVIPAECPVDRLENGKILVLDLAAPGSRSSLQEDDVSKWLSRWYLQSWERRQPAMESLFSGTASSFLDKETFVRISEDYFMDPYFKWERSGEDCGTVHTLAELQQLYQRFPICGRIPWVKERFIRKIPKLLAKNVELKQLCAEAAAQGLFAVQDDLRRQSQREYLYGVDMGGSDVLSACRATGALVRTQVEEEKAAELARQVQKTEEAIAAGQAAVEAEKENTARAIAAGEAAVEAEKENTAKAIAEGEAAVEAEKKNTAKAIAEGEAAVEAEKKNTAKAIAEGQAAVEAEKENTAKAIAEGQAAVAAERENTAKAIAEGQAAVAAEKENTAMAIAAGEAAVEAEKQNTAKAVAEGQAAVAAERENTAKAVAEGQAAVAAERENTAKAVAEGQAAVEAEKENTAKAVAAGQAAVEAEKENIAKAVAEGQAAVAAERENTAKAIAEGQAAVAAEKEHTAQVISSLEAEKQRAAQAVAALETEKQKTAQAVAEGCAAVTVEKETVLRQLRSAQEEASRLRSQLGRSAWDKVVQLEESLSNAEAENKRLKSEVRQTKKEILRSEEARKKQTLLAAVIGFAVAALIGGIALTVVLLSRPKAEVQPPTTVTEDAAAIPEETETPPTATEDAVTIPEETETPTTAAEDSAAIPEETPISDGQAEPEAEGEDTDQVIAEDPAEAEADPV